jgi:hypothetical protein
MSLEQEFERCKPWIESAIKRSSNTHDIDDVWEGIKAGTFLLWPGKESAAVTVTQTYPKKKQLHVFLAGGKLKELLDMWDCAEIYAKATGCASLSISGRKGWTRVLESRGAKYRCTTVNKEL